MKDRSLQFLLLGLLILGLLLGTYEEYWQQGAKKVITPELNTRENHEMYLEVICDASGSMWGREQDVEKIIKAKDVLRNFINKIPENDQINIGLRIFGARRVSDPGDSFLAVPVFQENRDNKKLIMNYVNKVKPLGRSPIGLSLEKAGNDLQEVIGKKYILLISDGIDNGNLPPEKVINDLEKNNICLHIIHVGDLNNNKLKDKLQNLAQVTGGKYYTYKEYEQIIPVIFKE